MSFESLGIQSALKFGYNLGKVSEKRRQRKKLQRQQQVPQREQH